MTGGMIAALFLLGVTVFALPFYCVLTYRIKSKATLTFKMFLSSLFVACALISLFTATDKRAFMFVMTVGFCICWIGDYILGKSERMLMFVIGSCTFAVGHVFYITAFSLAAKRLIPDYRWLNGAELGFFLALFALELFIMILCRPPFHKLFIPMFAYYAIVALMAAKSFGLTVRVAGAHPALWMLPAGALLFVFSDYSLGLMRFKVIKRTVLTKTLCTASYFFAQMLMALATFTLFTI